MTQEKNTQVYPIVSEYIAEHGVSEINSPELFKAVVKQIVNAIPDTISTKDIRLHFNVVLESMVRD